MFDFGRELKRLFGGEPMKPMRDGLTGGDQALLELLDLDLLRGEARAADIAAGRIDAKDRAQRLLEAAVVWREIARRSGDPAALRKAASTAEAAAQAFDRERRPDGWARARCEQGFCAVLGMELFGDEGLEAAAEIAFREARAAARGGLAAPLADAGIAAIEARRRMTLGDAEAARAMSRDFGRPIAALQAMTRRCPAARLLAAETRMVRIDLLTTWAARLKDAELLRAAQKDAADLIAGLDPAYEPLTWARASVLRGQALALAGEALGEVELLADAVAAVADVLEQIGRDHSPFDWARAQVALAEALQAFGESGSARAFEQAVTCYDRAQLVLKAAPAATLRAEAANGRALALARSAEMTCDLAVLDAAEAAFKIELTRLEARRDPVGWAIAQLNLARLYESRIEITRKDRGLRAAAAVALNAALDVFAEEGLRSLSAAAADALERLRGAGASPSPTY